MEELRKLMQDRIDAAYNEGFLQGRLAAQKDYFGEVDTQANTPKQVTMMVITMVVIVILIALFCTKGIFE